MIRLASDGLLAREAGIWTREKLTYLEKYAGAFTTAMRGKWDRLAYVDLLAGPGIDIEKGTNQEFSGSPLIALRVKPAFDQLFFADKNKKNIEALKTRIPAEVRTRVTVEWGDCNQLVEQVVGTISKSTLVLAFIDPQGFEVKFRTLQALATRQVDVIYLFPDAIGVRRNLADFVRAPKCALDEFWGDRDWRQLPVAERALSGHPVERPESIIRSFVEAFQAKAAKIGFRYHDEAAPLFANTRNAQMYHLLFLSRHPTALTIWRRVKRIAPGGQRSLNFGAKTGNR